MMPIQTVLCPVDFSGATDRQVSLAAALCRAFRSRLVLHHNLSSVAIGAGVGWMWNADHAPASEEAAEQRIGALAASLPDVEVQARITQGPDSASVLAVSEAVHADLVVLTTHNTPPEDHTSVTERVLESGRRPVLALHDAWAESTVLSFSPEAPARQLALVPVDATLESRAAVDFAFDLARVLPLEIHLLRLVESGWSGEPPASVFADAERALLAMVPDDCAAWTVVHARPGRAPEGVLREAGTLGAACLVMGERAGGVLQRLFRADASRTVLHKAPCPVWYVPSRRAA